MMFFSVGIYLFPVMRYMACAIFVSLLTGCATQLADVDTVKASLKLPSVWLTQMGEQKGRAENSLWWQSFNDPQLDALIAEGLVKNNDMAAASFRLKTALLQAGIVDTNMTPNVAAGFSQNIAKSLNSSDPSARTYGGLLSLSYELDFWGRLAQLRTLADWEAQASSFDRQDIATQLVGTIMQLYWKTGFFNERLRINNLSIQYAKDSLFLARVRKAAGAANELEVTQAEQQLETQLAAEANLIQQRQENRTALAILFDQSPQWRPAQELVQLPKYIPTIYTSVPTDVLAHRPDMKAAELRLRSSYGNIDSARLNFYPSITLNSALSTGGSKYFSDTLRNPVGSVGFGLALPFIQWNTVKLNIRVSESQYQEAVENFKKKLYSALKDVEDVLSARQQYQQEGLHLQRSSVLAAKAEGLAEVRYRSGQTGIKEWLDQQEARRNADVSLAENHMNQLITTMKFFQTIGGGIGERQE